MTGYGTVGLVDNDVVAKLAVCGLLDQLVPTLGLERVRVRGAMRYQMVVKPTRTWRRTLDDTAREEVRIFIDGCDEIDDTNTDFVSRCAASDIDIGEAILLDAARNDPNALLITGDKRFLRDLAGDAVLWSEVEHMDKQIILFEQVLRVLVNQHGFTTISKRVKPLCEQDNGVRMAFGPTQESNPERRCVEGLNSGIREVERLIAHMLCPIGFDAS